MMWLEPPEQLRLEEDEVHVWRAELTFDAAAEELSAGERERAARFHFDSDRQRFLASHVALRRILARYLGRPAAVLEFEIAPLGKPQIEGPVRFNMSHAGELALFAVARREVGVDVERLRPQIDVAALAARFLPAEEAREIAGVEGEDRKRAFLRFWTRREAWLKARGIGLAGIGEPVGPEWVVCDLDPGLEYAGAVACGCPEPRLRTWAYVHGRIT